MDAGAIPGELREEKDEDVVAWLWLLLPADMEEDGGSLPGLPLWPCRRR